MRQVQNLVQSVIQSQWEINGIVSKGRGIDLTTPFIMSLDM